MSNAYSHEYFSLKSAEKKEHSASAGTNNILIRSVTSGICQMNWLENGQDLKVQKIKRELHVKVTTRQVFHILSLYPIRFFMLSSSVYFGLF